MDRELFERIDGWFEAHREALLTDLERMVRIPSISRPSEPQEIEANGPFGPDCRRAMDEMLAIGREHGFAVHNREYYVGTIGEEVLHPEKTIGFWNHLDVVPVGEGWTTKPFEPVRRDGFLIGRGAQDNKGPAVGMIYLMECIRELGIAMRHELCLFVGCDEERGMADLEYYTAKYPTPALSMIADSGFPVCYGEKGIVEGQFVSKTALVAPLMRVWGGSASNMIPDRAYAELIEEEGLWESLCEQCGLDADMSDSLRASDSPYELSRSDGRICVTAKGTSRHSAFPSGSVNAIHELAVLLSGVSLLGEENQKQMTLLAETTKEYYGETEQIAFSDEVSGKTTCAGTVLTTENSAMCINLNIRYAITQDSEKLNAGLAQFAWENGLLWRLERDSKPNYFPKEHPAVALLTDLYNEWMGTETEAFVMGGGTYARKLPNAFAYGIGGMPKTTDDREREARLFAPGTGGAHEPDEGLNLRMFFEAMKFYTLAVIELDRIA